MTALPPPPPNMKNQHYVWAHYLNAWAESGSFCCYRQTDGKMLSTKPRAVASGTYFYEPNIDSRRQEVSGVIHRRQG